MLALLAEMARSEHELLKTRIASGLAEARRRGQTLGRPVGTRLAPAALLQKHRDVVRLLKAGQSVRNTAKIAGKGASTVQRVKALLLLPTLAMFLLISCWLARAAPGQQPKADAQQVITFEEAAKQHLLL
jgi:hypothetical protein